MKILAVDNFLAEIAFKSNYTASNFQNLKFEYDSLHTCCISIFLHNLTRTKSYVAL